MTLMLLASETYDHYTFFKYKNKKQQIKKWSINQLIKRKIEVRNRKSIIFSIISYKIEKEGTLQKTYII